MKVLTNVTSERFDLAPIFAQICYVANVVRTLSLVTVQIRSTSAFYMVFISIT